MLKLIAPGKRRNRFWIVRGRMEGRMFEKSLNVSLRADAEKKLRNLLREYDIGKNLTANITFEQAAEAYEAFRMPSEREKKFIARIKEKLGNKLVTEITQNDLVGVANQVYPNAKASTKNRAVIRPAAAVMHCAAQNKWCDWLRISVFKEAAPQTRFVNDNVERALLEATDGIKNLLVLWLFRQGDRIGDILGIKFEDCDLLTGAVNRHIAKSDRHIVLPLDAEICTRLKALGTTAGFIFPWRTRSGVHKWLRPLCQELGVEFTPHRARHTLGKRLNDTGAGLKTIMQALGQADPKSAIRYQTTDLETIRRAKEKSNERDQSIPAASEGRAANTSA